jgi:two-component system nitrogen regulation sensor histidine kinase GlnL
MIGVAFMPAVFTHFILHLVKAEINRKLIVLNYLGSLFIVGTIYTPLFAHSFVPFLVFPCWGMAGILFPFHLAHFFANVLYSHYKMFQAIRKSDSIIFKKQIGYVFLGTIVGYVGGISNYPCWYHIPFPPVINIFVSVYVCAVAYAVIRYRLLDINVVLTRASIFIVVYLVVLGIPFSVGIVGREFLANALGVNWWLLPSILSTIFATVGPFAYIYFKRRADSVLLKDQYLKHARLAAEAQHMPHVRDREKLCDSIVNMPPEILDSAYASIYLFEREKNLYSFCVTKYGKKRNIKIEPGNLLVKYLINVKKPIILEELKREYDRRHDVFLKEVLNTMNKLNADVVVPFLIEVELIGFLVLGFKKSGEIYSTDDLNVLTNLAGQAALAIENAQFLKEREEMQVKLREEQTLKAIGDLAGIVSHEMGNILNKVSQRVQTMMRGSNSDPVKFKESLENMDGNIASAKSIWSSINEYKEKTFANVISMHPLAEDISRAFNHSKKLMDIWNIKTSVSFINSRITIIGIGTLPDIFKHLVINSAYGMETTGGEIIYSAKVIPDKNTIEIVQEDTGSGLAGDIANHKTCGGELFAEQGKQGGVSFYIAKQIIYDHKGTLELQSNNGKGTRFVIRLPLDFTKA